MSSRNDAIRELWKRGNLTYKFHVNQVKLKKIMAEVEERIQLITKRLSDFRVSIGSDESLLQYYLELSDCFEANSAELGDLLS